MLKFKGIKKFLLRGSSCELKDRKGGYKYYFNEANNMYAYETASGNLMGFYIKKRIIQEIEDDIYIIYIMKDSNNQLYIAMTEKNKECNSFKENLEKEEILRAFDLEFDKWEQRNSKKRVATIGVATREYKIILDNGKEELEINLTEEEWKKLLEDNEKPNVIKLNPNKVTKIF